VSSPTRRAFFVVRCPPLLGGNDGFPLFGKAVVRITPLCENEAPPNASSSPLDAFLSSYLFIPPLDDTFRHTHGTSSRPLPPIAHRQTIQTYSWFDTYHRREYPLTRLVERQRPSRVTRNRSPYTPQKPPLSRLRGRPLQNLVFFRSLRI